MFNEKSGRWALIVHGGAKEMQPGEEDANREGILEAVETGSAILRDGGSAVDAVEAAIRVLEDLPIFNAGRGSAANQAGGVEMCAGLMDGRDLSAGAVGAIRQVRNPISVARKLLSEKEVLLVGEGATAFALQHGMPTATDEELLAEEEKELATHDTVGAVALDWGGNLAAGTSTGGIDGQKVGRIGDSPIPGSGLYADNHIGAISYSGDGESIARLSLASRVMAAMEAGQTMDTAIARGLDKLPGVGGARGDGGAIGITKEGRLAWAHNSPDFAVAYVTSDMESPKAFLKKDEEKSG
ncbi:MAG TPA: isoaspartyl peptidase/L-asparaginase family protein [Allosphingosinicella sp.]|jgi:beta-aspartyl-peptidase (threonine type)